MGLSKHPHLCASQLLKLTCQQISGIFVIVYHLIYCKAALESQDGPKFRRSIRHKSRNKRMYDQKSCVQLSESDFSSTAPMRALRRFAASLRPGARTEASTALRGTFCRRILEVEAYPRLEAISGSLQLTGPLSPKAKSSVTSTGGIATVSQLRCQVKKVYDARWQQQVWVELWVGTGCVLFPQL